MAASATLALKAGVWFRRGLLLIVSPVRGHHRRSQAETPLIDLFKFASPALSASLRHPLLLRDLHHSVVNLPDRVRIHSQAPTSHRLGVRRLAAAHTGEVAINQVGPHFAFQHV